MPNNNINFKINYQKGDTSAIDSLKKELIELKSLTTNLDMGLTEADLQQLIPAITTVEKALNSAFDVNLNTINIQKFNQILAQSGMNVKSLQQGLALAGTAGDKAFLHLTAQLMQFNTATKQTNKFLDSIANSFFNTIKYTVFNTVLNNISGTVQKAYGYVKSLDSSLNDIRIVTGKSADEMERFAEQANEAAKQLAVTTSDYTEGSLIYYQQGLDDETVKTLTDITAMTSNVTGQSMETVSEQLTAVWNGYQVANQAAEEGMQVYQEYVDKMAAVGAATASDLQELATAMSKVASAASSMGVGFDDLAAQIATIVSVTRQAPESVGTALKTIYARLGDLKVDGVDEFGTKLGEVSTQLQTMGIDILDTNGDMRDMSSVMAEVAEKWDTWTSAQRQAAAVAMAGKRQYNNLVALFDNWDMYGEALETSMGAVGTLEEQQEIALESLANKFDILSATAEDFYDSLLDENSLKGLVEGLTEIVQLLADFADATGGLNNLLPLLGSTALRVFNQQIADSLSTIIINMRTAKSEQEIIAQNAVELQSLFANSSLYQTQSNTATDQARLSSLKELEQYYNKMQQYQSIMSQEEKEQYNNILNMTEQAGRLNIELANQKENWKNIRFNTNLFSQDLTSNEKDLIKINSEINKIANIASEISNYADTITDETTILRSNGKFANFEQYITNLGADYNLTGNQIQIIIDKFNTLGNIPLKEKLEKISEALRQVGLSASEIIKLESEIINTTEVASSLGNVLSTNLDTKLMVQNISQLIGAFGQLISAINILKNVKDIWSNEDLSDGEKLLQTIMNLSMVLPMLISSYTTLNEAMKKGTLQNILYSLSLNGQTKAAEGAAAAQWKLNAAMDANPFGVVILVIGALIATVYGLAKAYDALTISNQEASENLKQSADKYNTAKTELDALNEELKSTQDRIKELQKLAESGKISITEQKELDNLQIQNDKLQRQIELKERLVDLTAQQTARDAKVFVDKGGYDFSYLDNNFTKSSFEEGDEAGEYITTEEGTFYQEGKKGKYALKGPDLDEIASTDYEGYKKWLDEVNELYQEATNDALDTNLNEADRKMAQKAADWYSTVLEERSSQWIENYESSIEQLEQDYNTIINNTLPALYAQREKENYNGFYDDTIKQYEEAALTYFKSTGTLEDTLQKILSSSLGENFDLNKIYQESGLLNIENQTVDEQLLSNIIGDESLKKLQDTSELYGLSLFQILTNAKNFNLELVKIEEETNENIEKLLESVTENLGTISSSIETLSSGKELSDDQIIGLEKLEQKYLELGEAFRTVGRESREYIEVLKAVQEAEEETQQDLLKQQLNSASQNLDETIRNSKNKFNDEGQIKTEIEIAADMDEVTGAISDVFDKKYELEVSLTEDVLSDIDSIVNKAENAANAISKIGKGFEVAAEDAESLFNIFPELAENAKILADGTIQLDNQVTSEILSNYGTQIDADKQKTVQEINNRIEELKAEKAKVEATLEQVQQQHMTKDELTRITQEFALESNENIAISDKNTADAAITNSGVMTQAIIDNWAAAAQAAIEYGNIVQVVTTGGDASGMSVSGGTVKLSGATIEANTTEISKNIDEALKKQKKAVEEGLKKQVESYERQIADLTVGASKLLSSTDSIEKSAIDSLKDDDKKSSSSKDKDKELKKLEEEFDRYWEIHKALDQIDRDLKRMDKDQENLYGKELIRSLKQENELLANQSQLYEQLYAAQEQEAAELRGTLANSGVIFDASGAVLNYAEATAAALKEYNDAITAYNNGLLDDAALEIHEQKFEQFKKDLERYDTLFYTEMQETMDKIDDLRRQTLANNLKAWEVEIQLKLDFKELEREWNDFIKEVNEDFKSVFKDLRVDMKSMLTDAKTYIGDEGTINTVIGAVHDTTAEIDKMMGGGSSNMYESVSQAQEKLKELNEELLDSATALHDLWEEAWDNYLEGIDQVADAFDDLIERFERINDELEFQEQIIELLYGDEAYALMNKLYEGQERNTAVQLQSLKTQVDMWKDLFYTSGATLDNQTSWTEDQQKYYEQWMEAQSALNDLVIDYIELLKKDYLNTVSSVLQELEKYVTGSSLDDLNTQWERISDNADKYYDSVEGAYYIQTLANKIDESIADADDLKAQQKLMALREKEINYLREKENLTEYDIKAAELRYQIALKEIALENAQNNKTGMKLTRNEQGNWSYQYVADETDIATKQQELLDAYNNLYQLASDAYEANLEALQELQEKYLESAKAIYEDDTLTEEERQAKLLELREWYLEQYKLLSEENQLYRNDLASSGAALLLEIYEQDQEAYESMTENERELVDALINANIDDYMELEDRLKDNYQEIGDKAKEVMSETRLDWTSGAQTIADLWNKDSGWSVKTQVVKAYEAIEEANRKYKEAVDWCAEAVERNFSEEGIVGAIQAAEYETDSLRDKTVEMVNTAVPYLQELRSYVDQIEAAWRSVQQAITDAISLIDEYLRKVGEANAAAAQSASTGPSGSSGSGSSGSGSGDSSSSGEGPGSGNSYSSTIIGGQTGRNLGTYTGSSQQAAYQTAMAAARSRYGDNYGDIYGNGKYVYVEELKTGGYTGSWGDDSGKLAMLHQKELVLNADDTKNFLSGINTIRDLSSNVGGSIQDAVLKAVANTALSLGAIKANGVMGNIANNNSSTDNVFNITAEFPNANSVDDIREAILSLPNIASQYANSTLK